MKRLGLALLSLSLIYCSPSEKKESPSWEGPGQRTGESRQDFQKRCQTGDGSTPGVLYRSGTLCVLPSGNGAQGRVRLVDHVRADLRKPPYPEYAEFDAFTNVTLNINYKGTYIWGGFDEGPNGGVSILMNGTGIGSSLPREQKWFYVPDAGTVTLNILPGRYKGGNYITAYCYGVGNDYEACPNPLPPQ